MEELFTPEMAGSGQYGICQSCKKPPDSEGHDGCLGRLGGDIMNACCGHGNNAQAYIQYSNKDRISGDRAVTEQQRLIKLRGDDGYRTARYRD